MRNFRSIVWLLSGIGLLVAAHVMLSLDGSQKAALVPRTSLLEVSDEAVTGLEIVRGGATESALVRDGGRWRLVRPYAASVDEAVVCRLLDALSYGTDVVSESDRELLRTGHSRADYDLADPALSVRVRAGASVTTISFGKELPVGGSVYAAVDGVESVFVVPKSVRAAVDVPTAGFRRKALFDAGADSVASFDIKRGNGEFLSFRREGGGWRLTQPQEVTASATKVAKLLSDVTGAQAVSFVWPASATNEVGQVPVSLLSSYRLGVEDAVTLTLKGVDGVDRCISFGGEKESGLVYALVDNGTSVVAVDRALRDAATIGFEAFADTRLFPLEASKVTGLSLVDGDVSCLLAKNADGTWRMDSPVTAPASVPAVEGLLATVLSLRAADADETGVAVSVAPDARVSRVSRFALGASFRLENLRSLDVLSVSAPSVKRLSVTGSDANGTVSVVYDRDRDAWNVESAPVSGTVSTENVARLLAAVAPLRAVRVVKLKVSAGDLGAYGLDRPRLKVAIDFAREDSVRRNILVGARAPDGYFATVGASDAVFVLADDAVASLGVELVGE